ncbi:MAG: MYXO-CTERM sorting domain-containing protein [Myxococcota bacterium]
MRRVLALTLLIAGPAWAAEPNVPNGTVVDGYPNYQERLTLVAINRARTDSNNPSAGTAGACSAMKPPTQPLRLSYAGSHATRFHCQNLLKNMSGLSHDSYCTLKSDVATSGCDGSDACACQPGTQCFSCTTLGGCGTDPFARAGLFGWSANGEVGAAGYADGWAAVEGWVTECPPQDGHRQILTGADKNAIGLGHAEGGGGCWSSFDFGDTGNLGGTAPVLAAGVHRPEIGSSVEFYTTYASRGAATAVNVVVDGVCHPMSIEIGQPALATYHLALNVGAGCHEYYFVAEDEAHATHSYPGAGAYGVGSCSDFRTTRMSATCAANLPDAGVLPADTGVVMPRDTGVVMGPDSGTADLDAGAELDSGAVDLDAGAKDAKTSTTSGNGRTVSGRTSAGCGCAASGEPSGSSSALLVLVALGLFSRRRGGRPSSQS